MSVPSIGRANACVAFSLAASLALAACGGGSGNGDAIAVNPTAVDVSSQDRSSALDVQSPAMNGQAVTSTSTEDALSSTDGRESAQAASGNCTPNYATPKVGAVDFSRDLSAGRQALLAKFDVAIVNAPYNTGTAAMKSFTAGIKARSANTKVAQYLNFPEIKSNASANDYDYGLAREATARGWWLLDASGAKVARQPGGSFTINATSWTKANPAGQRYPQFKAQYDNAAYLENTGVDFVFSANTFEHPWVGGDWKRIGKNQVKTDAAVQSATRKAYAAYWNSLRSLQPGVEVVAHVDNNTDLSDVEFKGVPDGAYLDGLIGQPWSMETWGGWSAMMEKYHTVIANTSGSKTVFFSSFGATPTDYKAMRYGLASALMDNGIFVFRPIAGSQSPIVYDEFNAQIGNALEDPPTAPTSKGIYLRHFQNGLVLVNPQAITATINVGSGYQRLSGTQDPAVNNGQAQTSVTLGPRQGLLMIKTAVACPAPTPSPTPTTSFATPKVAALDFSHNISAARAAFLAKYHFVIVSTITSQKDADINRFLSSIKSANSSTKIAQYIANIEFPCSSSGTSDTSTWNAINSTPWWLFKADKSRSQWTTKYGTCDLNLTSWAPRNKAGQTLVQYKWAADYNSYFKSSPLFDYAFHDNVNVTPKSDADYKRIGTNQSHTDPVIAAAFRAGMRSIVAGIHAKNLKVMGNIVDSDLSQPEYQGQLEGAHMEALIGRSWSWETWGGWANMMARYRTVLANTKSPKDVVFNVVAAPNDYATVRYGLASAMMEDGYFSQQPVSGLIQPIWYDEFSAPIGNAVDAPPKAAAQNGIWMRKYSNGLVLVNSSKTATASINVGSGYRRLKGTQDPAVNNGAPQSIVTLGPRQGLLMIRN